MVFNALQQSTLTQAFAEAENKSERDEAILSAMPASERRKLELSIRKLHHTCGHPPNHVLVRTLRWKGAEESVLSAARLFRCSACKRAEPAGVKSVSASHEHPVSETRKSALVDMRR